jgi:outer membrane protein TolC
MKVLLILLIIAAAVGLYLDDKGKRADLAQTEVRAEAAEQQLVTEQQQVEHLTAQIVQLQAMLGHSANIPAQTTRPSSVPPAWFQDHLNGAPSVLDPHAGTP